ncbi:MAG TPA: ABC transporter ATP-binding protein [Stellaceae bacterium]|jgi:NitT/TauT family transport system ATP-binding protein|nr:ABC transporter ATP-binding protein [Stellaceae bacterium]
MAVSAEISAFRAGGAPIVELQSVGYEVAGKSPLVILQDISLSVREGEFLCVVGASGCGKTTLLRLIAGLLPVSRGELRFHGNTVTGPGQDRAIVFQDYSRALLPWRTIAGNVALALEARGTPRRERAAIVERRLRQVGLWDWRDRFPGQLSGGMQQRLQIARCLAQEPDLLLMDEPFGALDAMTRQVLQDEVTRLSQESGTTVVFVTHDLEEAIYLGDRVVAMESRPGRIATSVEIDLPRPRHQLTTREDRRFLAYRHQLFNLLPAHA